MKTPLLLDCDPGHDDAIAITLLANQQQYDVLGITVVSGNQTLEKTARNAFNVSRYVGLDVPIALGASKPLKRTRLNCSEIHGESGLDGFDFPDIEPQYDERNAADFIKDKLLSVPSAIVVTTGPMTNLATALTKYPEIKTHIEKIVLMGGSTGAGNLTPYAEFNILADPDAAKICFESGLPLRMIGLNVTRKLLVLPEALSLCDLHTKTSDMFLALMAFFNKTQREFFGLEAGPLHDPATIVSLLDENVFSYEKMDVAIVVSPGDYYGATHCSLNPNGLIEVAVDVDISRYWAGIKKGLSHA